MVREVDREGVMVREVDREGGGRRRGKIDVWIVRLDKIQDISLCIMV